MKSNLPSTAAEVRTFVIDAVHKDAAHRVREGAPPQQPAFVDGERKHTIGMDSLVALTNLGARL
jgi:hypothetical protein